MTHRHSLSNSIHPNVALLSRSFDVCFLCLTLSCVPLLFRSTTETTEVCHLIQHSIYLWSILIYRVLIVLLLRKMHWHELSEKENEWQSVIYLYILYSIIHLGILAFYLSCILAFYLSCILSVNLSCILAFYLSCILSSILSRLFFSNASMSVLSCPLSYSLGYIFTLKTYTSFDM